tara:strand:+ start:617 stop:1993 length:1377 start_codon:yes stop_codon:yes gene_type:complete
MKNLTILLLLLATITVNAADIVVNGSGLAGTYTTISAAVQAANEGDKILVSNQAFPYQEDTLFINKGVTILPYSDITHIDFEGDIMITLDSVSELTLIGFNSDNTDILSVFNDTSRNSLSTVNIVDCYFHDINLDQPKTSLYLSYSTVYHVYFSHGNIIGNDINGGIQVGIHDFPSHPSTISREFFINNTNNYLGYNSTYYPSACDLFTKSIDFGNVSVYSDTINIIANDLDQQEISILTRDFPVHIYNNKLHYINLYLICPPNKGVNRIINNQMNGSYSQPIRFMMTYCSSSTPTHNIEHINLHILNNNIENQPVLFFDSPQNNNQLNQSYMTILSTGIASYNTGYGSSYNFESGTFPLYTANNSYGTNSNTTVFQLGPGTNNNNYNPSAEYLNLDLTPNTAGKEGGSHAFNNYNPSGSAGFNTMTGSKARITYLNLPTLIFDPSNIQIKAKAVHGN